MFLDVLPLRAVVFQFLFLLMAIAIEAVVFYRILNLDYKTSMQYSATVNLLSTVLGWLIFFNVQALLPEALRSQLISYIFFERFFAMWTVSVAPILVVLSLAMFLGTFLVKLKGLEFLEKILEKTEKEKEGEVKPDIKPGRFRSRKNQAVGFKVNSRPYAVLLANACSFSAILFLLVVRLVEQAS